MPKAKVHLLATGGTIAGLSSAGDRVGYMPGELSIDTLLASVPSAHSFAEISFEQIASIGSQDITENHWFALVKKIRDFAFANPDTGIVILHGTDTIEETAWFLDLVSSHLNPIVMVGAMRPANAVGADGPGNLLGGIVAAADRASFGRGVMIYSDNEIYAARNATKIGTLGSHGFSGGVRGIDAYLSGDKIEWLAPQLGRRLPKFDLSTMEALPRVEIIYVHASMTICTLERLLESSPQGVVVAGVGAGNMPLIFIDRLADAASNGLVVIRSSRITGGVVSRNVEIDDDIYGFVAAGDLGPAKSRILAQLALVQTQSVSEIQSMFARC